MSEQSKGHVKKGDFVEMNFTARIISTENVFDTTRETDAKKYGIYNKEIKYQPIIIVAGEGHLVKGLDEFIIGKEPGHYTVPVDAEKGFGKKNAKLLRLISLNEFRKHQIQAVPGLEVEMDGSRGIVRTVNGGRVIVDFNHPLSSQDLEYDIDILLVDDDKKKIDGLLHMFKIPHTEVIVEDKKATIKAGVPIPEEVITSINEEIKRLSGIEASFVE